MGRGQHRTQPLTCSARVPRTRSRVLLCGQPGLCCQPRLVEASPRPPLSYVAASYSACAAACPARSSSCFHSPPDPCRTLGQPLCARYATEVVLQSGLLRPSLRCALLCPDRVAVAVPMCGWAVATALGHSHVVGVGESGHELGSGS